MRVIAESFPDPQTLTTHLHRHFVAETYYTFGGVVFKHFLLFFENTLIKKGSRFSGENGMKLF
jgi:hypothetical protein